MGAGIILVAVQPQMIKKIFWLFITGLIFLLATVYYFNSTSSINHKLSILEHAIYSSTSNLSFIKLMLKINPGLIDYESSNIRYLFLRAIECKHDELLSTIQYLFAYSRFRMIAETNDFMIKYGGSSNPLQNTYQLDRFSDSDIGVCIFS